MSRICGLLKFSFINEINKNKMCWKPDVLVVGPGGIKGFLYLGFLVKIEDEGILDDINVYCGISVGSFILILRIIGYSFREIIEMALKYNLIGDISAITIPNAGNKYGFLNQENNKTLIETFILKKLKKIPTLFELYVMTGKIFITTTYNITNCKGEYITPFTKKYEKVSCVDIIIMSSAIPIIFQQYQMFDCCYIDGGLFNPYPINYLDDGNHNILGVYIKVKPDVLNESIDNYIDKVIDSTILTKINEFINNSSKKCKHFAIKYKKRETLGINITTEDKGKMVMLGYVQADKFLKSYKNEFEFINIKKSQKFEYPETVIKF